MICIGKTKCTSEKGLLIENYRLLRIEKSFTKRKNLLQIQEVVKKLSNNLWESHFHIQVKNPLSGNTSTRLRMYKILLFKFRGHLCKGTLWWQGSVHSIFNFDPTSSYQMLDVLNEVRSPSLPATTPYSCHGIFTDRSILALNLSRIQIPTGTSLTNCNNKH